MGGKIKLEVEGVESVTVTLCSQMNLFPEREQHQECQENLASNILTLKRSMLNHQSLIDSWPTHSCLQI